MREKCLVGIIICDNISVITVYIGREKLLACANAVFRKSISKNGVSVRWMRDLSIQLNNTSLVAMLDM